MLEDLAENSSSEIARLQAIETLLELDGEDEGKQEENPLYPSELEIRRKGRAHQSAA